MHAAAGRRPWQGRIRGDLRGWGKSFEPGIVDGTSDLYVARQSCMVGVRDIHLKS